MYIIVIITILIAVSQGSLLELKTIAIKMSFSPEYYILRFEMLISGTFCEKDSDCKEACCVLEPTINSHLPICKPTLEEYHQCAAILYRKIWVGEKPDCGPCKPGLECAQKG